MPCPASLRIAAAPARAVSHAFRRNDREIILAQHIAQAECSSGQHVDTLCSQPRATEGVLEYERCVQRTQRSFSSSFPRRTYNMPGSYAASETN